MDNKTLIFIALSGGVDSSVVLQLLKKQYNNLQGISHVVWPESLCCTTECLDQCYLQCQQAEIPYENIDCIQEFSKKIIDPFVQNYFDGITPNPCVLCNQYVRFDLMVEQFFINHPEKQTDNYKLATGHYAQVEEKDGRYYLKKGIDPLKDQAFVLYRLSQKQLSHCLFPLGKMTKPEVRALAGNMQLSVATKKDSMGACFAGDDYRDFIREYSGKKIDPGNFVDQEANVLGEHQGYQFYTRGQRKGLGLSGGPWYVFEVKPATNEVILAHGKEDLLLTEFYVKDLVWHYPEKKLTKATVQTRHHAPELNCELEYLKEDLIKVTMENPYAEISAGQSAVFYDGDYVMGGGRLAKAGRSEELSGKFREALRLTFFLSLPAAAGLLALDRSLIELIYEWGKFGPEDTTATAGVLFFYAVGIPAFCGLQIVTRLYYATEEVKTPVWTGAVMVFVNLGLNLLLVGPMREGGLALATSLTAVLNLLILVALIPRRLGLAPLWGVVGPVAVSAALAAVMGFAVYALGGFLASRFPETTLVTKLMRALPPVIIGAGLYVGLAFLLRLPETRTLRRR